MNLEDNKNYLLVIISAILFLAAMSYAAYLYLKWNDAIDEKKYAVEVSLPVVNWDQYLKLSKQR